MIFKSGFDVKGIKAAAAIWITGALGLAIATSYWPLGLVAGLITRSYFSSEIASPTKFGKKSKNHKEHSADPHAAVTAAHQNAPYVPAWLSSPSFSP